MLLLFDSLLFCVVRESHMQHYMHTHKSLIRPHMEYACAVWDPHLAKDVKLMMFGSLL